MRIRLDPTFTFFPRLAIRREVPPYSIWGFPLGFHRAALGLLSQHYGNSPHPPHPPGLLLLGEISRQPRPLLLYRIETLWERRQRCQRHRGEEEGKPRTARDATPRAGRSSPPRWLWRRPRRGETLPRRLQRERSRCRRVQSVTLKRAPRLQGKIAKTAVKEAARSLPAS